MLGSVIAYCVVYGILFSFLLLLIMMYDNKVGELYETDFDYLLTYFDERNVQELEENESVKQIYISRIVTSTVCKSEKDSEIDIDLHLVDEWDTSGLTFLGENRKIYGKMVAGMDNGIILDVLTARTLRVGLGDKVEIAVADSKIEYIVMAVVKPDFCFGNRFVCTMSCF